MRGVLTLLAFRIDHSSQSGWADKQRHVYFMAQDRAACIDIGNILHHPWSKPYPLVHALILVPCPAVRSSSGVESHGLRRCCSRCRILKIVTTLVSALVASDWH